MNKHEPITFFKLGEKEVSAEEWVEENNKAINILKLKLEIAIKGLKEICDSKIDTSWQCLDIAGDCLRNIEEVKTA